jgi:hypothetical protein
MKDFILSTLSILILFSPTALKVDRDRNGVKHPDPAFIVFIGIMIGAGFIAWCVKYWPVAGSSFTLALLLIAKYSIVSASFYASIFPYWINYVHLKNGVTYRRLYYDVDRKHRYRETIFKHVASHLSDFAWPDKTWWWRALGWRGRMIVNALILIGGLTLFFI